MASTMSHFHRAEIARMAGWRDRLDRTTNWAVTVAAAMLSVSLSTPSSHHGVLLFAMLLLLQLLWIEARRYRFFDVYRARVRQFERYYFAQLFSPQDNFASNWLLIMGETLRTPQFLISTRAAFARRLRRNYIHLFSILLLAWVLKLTSPTLQVEGQEMGLAASTRRAIGNAALGPLPGWLVFAFVAVFYCWLIYTAYIQNFREGELSIGDVHV
ncbi:DUF2270 domain-containing protein [Rhizobium sp. KVB221]|uniref:DUF2270 domain-containing protein n=2 Tax=Rhizobium setariae TaxID=2801340 RepID=A0A937CP45_9HYPH|nr:DUF2270 domain-containing protein [Rhizobium setariae]MBL0372759.1 DUF2270 domain-containing protein [Rhizobium setariae]